MGAHQRAAPRPTGRSSAGASRQASATSDGPIQSAQTLAGNAAVTEALQGRRRRTAERAWDRSDEVDAEEELDQQSTRLPVDGAEPLHLVRPVMELGLDGAPLRRLARARGPTNARTVAAALSGRSGVTEANFAAGTRAATDDTHASFAVDRRSATVRGRLSDFRGVRLLPADAPTSTGRRMPLKAIAPSKASLEGGLRIRIDNVDLTRGRTGVTVTTDGAGHIELAFRFDDGTLRMVGTDRADFGEGLDWTYLLTVDLVPFGTAVWRTMPRRRRFVVPLFASGAATPPDGDKDKDKTQDQDRTDEDLTARARTVEQQGPDDEEARAERELQEGRGAQRSRSRSGSAGSEHAGHEHAGHEQVQDGSEEVGMHDTEGPVAATAGAGLAAETAGHEQQDDVVGAARAYLAGLDLEGADHPATAERLAALRTSLAAHDAKQEQDEDTSGEA